jgi:prolyl-tRNA editing enzyme YbaK/EbsC (Cys-tRNA(Pro) deacylase)
MNDKNKILNSSGPRKVSQFLIDNDLEIDLVVLDTTARTAKDAADSIGVDVGAIVKSLVFNFKEDSYGTDNLVMALVSGDKKCDTSGLEQLLDSGGRLIRPDADFVKRQTGYSIGGVSPLGLPENAKIFVDKSLSRFKEIWAAAGHPYCVYKSTYSDLILHSRGVESDSISI